MPHVMPLNFAHDIDIHSFLNPLYVLGREGGPATLQGEGAGPDKRFKNVASVLPLFFPDYLPF